MDVLKRIYQNRYSDIPESDEKAYNYLINKNIKRDIITGDIKKVLGLEYFNFENYELNSEFLNKFNKEELKSRRIIPINCVNGEVYFVINKLLDMSLKKQLEELAFYSGNKNYKIVGFLIRTEFEELLESLWLGLDLSSYKREIKKEIVIDVAKERLVDFDSETMADLILTKGFENRASDIHIEPIVNGFQVRYRVDGVLSIIDPFDVSESQYQSLVNYFKIKSGMKIEEKRKGQDGRLRDRKFKGNSFDLRISSIASTLGEKIAVRILDKASNIPSMKDLGFNKFYINAILTDTSKPNGLIINTGSTGSGKSTTQRTLLFGMDVRRRNIYSIEDPVERMIPFINHICVKETSVSFEDHLENLLRQDPDVIAIGEVRNAETMDIALKASLSGQLVFATLHTNSAIEALFKISNMGIEPYELGSALLGIGNQRLVRTLCPYCKRKVDIKKDEAKLISGLVKKYENFSNFNVSNLEYLHEAVGCEHCNHTGYYGRTVVAEYLSCNDEIKERISNGNLVRDDLYNLVDDSFVPIEIDAINKVILGKSTLSEIIKAIKI